MAEQRVEALVTGQANGRGIQSSMTPGNRWATVIGGLLTAAMTFAVIWALPAHDIAGLLAALPTSPAFYVAFALLYVAGPVADYVIFRRLWAMPIAGLTALFKKRIANEVLLGYSGEAYFYAWARQRSAMVAAPFGAVKDVSILSAIAGNAATLAMILLALPYSRHLLGPAQYSGLIWSAGIVIVMSLPFLLFSKRVFTLAGPALWWTFGVHMLRLVAATVLLAVAWHFALPGVSVGTWLLLSAGRLLASRLPLVPNKDLVFANFAILLIGQGHQLATLVAVTAALTLLVHVVLVVVFGVVDVVRKR